MLQPRESPSDATEECLAVEHGSEPSGLLRARRWCPDRRRVQVRAGPVLSACFGLSPGFLGTSLQTMNAVADIKTAARGLVVSNPGILGGTPVFNGTRLPVQTLF